MKKNLLSKYFTHITDFNDFNCPSLRKDIQYKNENSCFFHKEISTKNCAAKNVLALRDWYDSYRQRAKLHLFLRLEGVDETDDVVDETDNIPT